MSFAQREAYWLIRWNKEGNIVEAKALLDADLLEKVFGGEQRKLGLATA